MLTLSFSLFSIGSWHIIIYLYFYNIDDTNTSLNSNNRDSLDRNSQEKFIVTEGFLHKYNGCFSKAIFEEKKCLFR